MSQGSGAIDNFQSPNHALRAGMLWGLFIRKNLNAMPEVDDAGNYTDVIKVEHEGYEFRVQVLPPGGDDV